MYRILYPTRTQERPKFSLIYSKTMLESKVKVLLLTVPMVLLGTMSILVVQSTVLPVLAQPAGQAPVDMANQTQPSGQTAVGMANETQPGDGTASSMESEVSTAGLLRQGQISSSFSDVPGRDDMQVALIVPPRDDNTVLSGILTYQASRPVDLFVWNNVEFENTTAIPEEFGELDDIVNVGGKTFALAEVGSGSSSSVPFTGNAIEVVGGDEPFIVTYSLNAFPALADLVSDLRSLNTFNATSDESNEDEE